MGLPENYGSNYTTDNSVKAALKYINQETSLQGLSSLYYQILSDKRCSENSTSLDSMGLEGMLELQEMLDIKDALESVHSKVQERKAASARNTPKI